MPEPDPLKTPTAAVLGPLPQGDTLALFRRLYDHSLEGALLTRPTGEFVALNETACRIFGASEDALRERSRDERGRWSLVQLDDPRLARLRAERVAHGAARGTVQLRRFDGEPFEAEVSSFLFLDENGVPSSVLTVRDVEALRRAERAALESEARLRFALDAAEIGDWDRDLHTGYTRRSARHDRCFGYRQPPPVWTYETFLEHMHPDDRAHADAAYQRAMRSGGETDIEFRVTWPDGSLHWLWSKGRFYFDAAGQPYRVAGILIDISERRRAEQELRDSEQRLRLALHGGDLGLWDWDIPHGHLSVNERWRTQLGLRPEDPSATVELWHSRVHPDDLSRMKQALARVVDAAGHDDFESEVRVQHADGRWIWILDRGAVVERDADGRALRVAGTHADISARKHGEQLLRERELALVEAQRLAGVGSWRWHLGADVSELSDEVMRLFGVEPGGFRVTYRNVMSMVHPEDRERVDGALKDALAGRRPYDVEYRIRTPAGEERHLHGRARVVFDPVTGRASTVLGTVLDITERKRQESELARHRDRLEQIVQSRTAELVAARDAAEQANRAKSSFLSRMSHELRTPLNAVLGFSQLLEMDEAIAARAPVLNQVSHIRTAGTHLLAMIDDVLDVARIEAGGLRLSCEPVALAPLLAGCVASLAPLAERHGVSLQVQPGEPLHALADRIRLRQVVDNLVSNAIKYNRAGGQVRIGVAAVPGGVEMSIADTGRGLDGEQIANLFQPFNRLGAESSGIEGTGLGLVIARQLLEAMGGSLNAESAVGEGSVFRALLPRAAAPAPVADLAPAVVAVPGGGRPMRVLIVEDNEINVELMRQALGRVPGLVLHVAIDGPSGLQAVRELSPDLVLMDIDLPGLSGLEVLRAIRADPALAPTTCIAVSADAMGAEVQKARDAGFADYLTKPFALSALTAAVEAHRPRA